jgi:integrase
MGTLASVSDFTPHDLRRTGATLAQAAGVPMEWTDRLQDHKLKGVTGVYQRFGYFEEKRIAAFATENHVRRILRMPLVEMPKRKGALV